MRTARPKSLLERSANADLWLHTLTQIPVVIGRLVYLASLRNTVTGRYEHHGLSLVFGEAEAEKAIRGSHRKVFQEWLAEGLENKVEDLATYLDHCGEDPRQVLRHWAGTEAWHTFYPTGTLAAEKSLFASDMRSAVRILSQRYGAVAQGHSA